MDLPDYDSRKCGGGECYRAALALSTIELTVHVDTKRRLLVIPELGIKQQTCTLKRVEQVVERVKEALSEEALRLGLGKDQDIEVISIEDFPVVDGWQSMERFNNGKSTTSSGGETVCGIKAYPIVSVMDLLISIKQNDVIT